MSIKKALDFVKGSIAKKDLLPSLTHLQIKDGYIFGFNGYLSLGAAIDIDFNICPKAAVFIKAINANKHETTLSMTKGGKLRVQAGDLTVLVPCTDEDLPVARPTGKPVKLGGSIIPAVRKLAPFIAQDASRSWARGICFDKKLANATNNITLVQAWLGFDFPIKTVLPESAVKELLRIGEEPDAVVLNDSTFTFLYSDGRWLTTNLLDPQWPDISPILDREAHPVPFEEDFFAALKEIAPFCDEYRRVTFSEDHIATGEAAKIDFEGLPEDVSFNIDQLLNLEGRATKIDFTMYPEPCIFYGDGIRGAIVGMTK